MEVVVLLLLIVLFIVVITTSSRNREVLHKLSDNLFDLTKEVRQLKQELKQPGTEDLDRWAPKPVTATLQPIEPTVQQAPPVPVQSVPMESIPAPEPQPIMEELHISEEAEPHKESPKEESEPVQASLASQPGPSPAPANEYYQPQEGWWDRWMRNNPDMEKFIGENLINKIGIAILVLGIAFFVKYAIDKEWINEVGRVCIGLGCGAALVGVAHYMRNSYRAFSSVLAGGGIAVFYFTIALAFHEYHLISQTAAFVIMVVVTAFAVILSIAYDKLELAVIAAIGGFLTPFMVSTGEGNYIVLFTYLVILNAGLLALSYRKRWLLINIISLFFTLLIYGGWLGKTLYDMPANFSYPLALLFASLFYVQFLGMNMINQVRYRQPFKAFDFSILLLINALYFSAGMILLHGWHDGKYQGIFTVMMGCVNLVLAYWFFRREGTDKRLLFLLIGMTLTFLSLAIPVQLHGHTITLFWSAEFVLLYWLYQRSGISMFRYSSVIVCVLAVISIMMDWTQASTTYTGHLTVIYKDVTGLVTNLVMVAAFAIYYWLVRRGERNDIYLLGLTNQQVRRGALGIAIWLLYLTAVFGVNLLCGKMNTYDVPNAYHLLITEVFALACMLRLSSIKDKQATWPQPFLFVVCFCYYLVSAGYAANLRAGVLNGMYDYVHLGVHWLGDAVLLYLCYRTIQVVRNNHSYFANSLNVFTAVISILLVIFFSIELSHLYMVVGHGNGSERQVMTQYRRAGLTITWAFCSFAMMWLGMKHKYKTLRIISLSLFALALFKLFVFDIRGISEGGKIAAFILLGVLLLVVSFMYQKLKKIIIDDKG